MQSRIRFNRTGEIVPLSVATADPSARKQWLAPHAGSATVSCLCAEPPIPMTVAHRQVGTETWYLCAADRETAKRHAPWCRAQSDAVDAKPQVEDIEHEPSIEVDEGGVTIIGGFARDWRESEADPKPVKPDRTREAAKSRTHPTLTLLLWALWGQAGLNVWKPSFAGKRSYAITRHRLLDAAQRIRIQGRSDWKLSEDLFMPPVWNPQDRHESVDFHREVDRALRARRVVFVLGDLRAVADDADGGLRLMLRHSRMQMKAQPGLAARLEKQTSQWAGGLRGIPQDERRMVLVRLKSTDGSDQAICIDAVLMRTSYEAIPVESSHEAVVAGRLIEQGRSFIKPLAAGNPQHWMQARMRRLGVVPDFVINDCFPAVFGEVFGLMNDPEYRERADEKILIYRQSNTPYWAWDTSASREPPPFPLPDPRKAP
ncbi:MAG: DUF1173 family protein [Acidobacteriaceae bacterium]